MTRRTCVVPVGAVTCAAALLGGCGGSTGGQWVQVEVAIESLAQEPAFTTDLGWHVQLTEAQVVLGPMYFYAPTEDTLAFLPERMLPTLWELAVPTARAHSGTDPLAGRIVRAEWDEQVLVDLLADESQYLGQIEAEAGTLDSATLILPPPTEEHQALMHGHHFWVRGEASKDGQTVVFEGGLDLPDNGLTRRVEPVTVDGELAEGSTVVLGIDPAPWFDGAHFDRLVEGEAGQPRAITADSQVRAAWFLGARDLRGYGVRLEEGLSDGQ